MWLQDYPSTAAEALALSSYGYSLNVQFEIYQVQENTDGTAPTDLKAAKEVDAGSAAEEGDETEQKHYKDFCDSSNGLR